MKIAISFLFLLVFSNKSIGQHKDSINPTAAYMPVVGVKSDTLLFIQPGGAIFTAMEEPPEFKGGNAGLKSFLFNNLTYPNASLEANVEGKVYVQFVVCTDGSLCDEKIIRGVDSNLDNEVLRVVRKMPKWKPGKQNGKEVR